MIHVSSQFHRIENPVGGKTSGRISEDHLCLVSFSSMPVSDYLYLVSEVEVTPLILGELTPLVRIQNCINGENSSTPMWSLFLNFLIVGDGNSWIEVPVTWSSLSQWNLLMMWKPEQTHSPFVAFWEHFKHSDKKSKLILGIGKEQNRNSEIR